MAKLKHFKVLYIKHFVVFITIIALASCKEAPQHLDAIIGKQLMIDSTASTVGSISDFITPYRERVDAVLDSTLAYAPYPISKTDGTYNTTAGNLMADVTLSQSNPIFKARTGTDIDFVLLNHGGIRSGISKGNVTSRTAYEVMPFENSIWVVQLDGTAIMALVDYLISSKRPHPIAGIQVILNTDETLNSITIQGKPFDKDKKYNVATSDYLVNGGDDMVFFKDALSQTDLNYKIRAAMLDYFVKTDTLSPQIDNRYYTLD